jgi:hypothetical protein
MYLHRKSVSYETNTKLIKNIKFLGSDKNIYMSGINETLIHSLNNDEFYIYDTYIKTNNYAFSQCSLFHMILKKQIGYFQNTIIQCFHISLMTQQWAYCEVGN